MNEIRNEDILRCELNSLSKEKLIDLFIKAKDINNKLSERVYLLENQINDMTDLDKLIQDIIEI